MDPYPLPVPPSPPDPPPVLPVNVVTENVPKLPVNTDPQPVLPVSIVTENVSKLPVNIITNHPVPFNITANPTEDNQRTIGWAKYCQKFKFPKVILVSMLQMTKDCFF